MPLHAVWSRKKEHLGDPGRDGKITLRWILRKCGCMDWIELAQVRDRCQALVNVVTKLSVP
jgi:hypothetical protein